MPGVRGLASRASERDEEAGSVSETRKLRELLVGEPQFDPHGSASGLEAARARWLAVVMGQSVLALEEQIESYQRHVGGSTVVQCKACGGSGYPIRPSAPCTGCNGSGLVRV